MIEPPSSQGMGGCVVEGCRKTWGWSVCEEGWESVRERGCEKKREERERGGERKRATA